MEYTNACACFVKANDQIEWNFFHIIIHINRKKKNTSIRKCWTYFCYLTSGNISHSKNTTYQSLLLYHILTLVLPFCPVQHVQTQQQGKNDTFRIPNLSTPTRTCTRNNRLHSLYRTASIEKHVHYTM